MTDDFSLDYLVTGVPFGKRLEDKFREKQVVCHELDTIFEPKGVPLLY